MSQKKLVAWEHEAKDQLTRNNDNNISFHNFKFKFKYFKFFRLKPFLDTVGLGIFHGIWTAIFGILSALLMFFPRDVLSLESSHPVAILFIVIGAIGILSCAFIGPYVIGFLFYILTAFFFYIGVLIINIVFNLIELIKYRKLKN
jgi:hypothetical protein